MRVSEVTGVEGENFSMQDLFVFKQTGVDENAKPRGVSMRRAFVQIVWSG